jgi:predicted AAA+ superfamily ATPase
MTLPAELVEDLRRQNPWWEQRALPELPPHRRHLVRQIHRRLEWKLAPVVVVRGPPQVGKTAAQLHWIEDVLKSGVEGRRILRVQFDSFPTAARALTRACVFVVVGIALAPGRQVRLSPAPPE